MQIGTRPVMKLVCPSIYSGLAQPGRDVVVQLRRKGKRRARPSRCETRLREGAGLSPVHFPDPDSPGAAETAARWGRKYILLLLLVIFFFTHVSSHPQNSAGNHAMSSSGRNVNNLFDRGCESWIVS